MPRFFIILSKLLFIVILIFGFNTRTNAQSNKGWVSKNGIFGTHYFIENKGQYEQLQHQVKNVLYAVQHHDEIYFTKTGFTFHLVKLPKIKNENKREKEDEEAEEEEMKNAYKNRKEEWIEMKWLNANPNVEVIAEDKSEHYFTYGSADLNSYGFKKLTYRNLYNGIDVIMELHPKGGIKYSVIAASAEALQQYQFEYTSVNKTLKTKLNNNQLCLINQCDTLIETGLVAKDETANNIAIQYKIASNIISFTTTNAKGKIIIDPWVTTLSTLTGFTNFAQKGYDVDFDIIGNLYVYGGGGGNYSPYYAKIAKYNSSGNLIWTFMGQLTSPNWVSTPLSGEYVANFTIDKRTQKVYVCQINFYGAQVIRLNTNGNYDNFISATNSNFREMWEMKFNCGNGKLLAFGGGTNSNLNFAIIDTTTAAVTSNNLTGFTTCCQDIVNCAINPNGDSYAIFASVSSGAVLNNKIYKFVNNYTSSSWNVPSGYFTLNEATNKLYLQNNSTNSNSFNCLAVNSNYLFYYDGYNLKAFNTSNGSVAGFASTIIGQSALYQGGIFASDSNEVYLGSKNGSILKYNFNGTNFTHVGSLPISGHAGKSTYDIAFNPSNGMLYLSGDSFVASVSSQSVCIDTTTLPFSIITNCTNQSVISKVTGAANSSYSYTFNWVDSLTGNTLRTITKPIGAVQDTLFNIPNNRKIVVSVIRNSACQFITNSKVLMINCNIKTVNICQGQPYALSNGHFINLAGLYADTLNNFLGIHDSIIKIQLIVHPIIHDTIHIKLCGNQQYVLPSGKIVNTTGIYNDTLINHFGCDSIITTNLKVSSPSSLQHSISICNGQQYKVGHHIYSASGTYIDTIMNYHGCDSVVTTTLKVKPTSSKIITASFCSGNSIKVGIHYYNKTGVYQDTLINYVGCDSVITTNLTIKPISKLTVNATICSNQLYTLPKGRKVNIAANYLDTLTNYLGCDSIITTHLKVNSIKSKTLNRTLCFGDSIKIGKHAYKTTGNYSDTLINYLGCDSILNLNLIVLSKNFTILQPAICEGNSFTVGPHIYQSTGNYFDTLLSNNGCDSTIITNLTILPNTALVQTIAICEGAIYNIGNHGYNSIGNYIDTIPNHFGCDSIINTSIQIQNIGVTIQALPDTLIYAGEQVVLSANYLHPTDSIITWSPLSTLQIKDVNSVIASPTNSTWYYVTTTTQQGCIAKDSILIVLIDLAVPNLFTPNEDGENDIFIARGNGVSSIQEFSVFNRWGEKIFTTNDYTQGWNGKYHGIEQEIGTYIYVIKTLSKVGNITKTLKGNFNLLR